MNCKECRWWSSDDEREGFCDLTARNFDPQTGLDTHDGDRHPDSKAHAYGTGSTSSAVLWTKSDFGCVQFRSKSNPPAP